MFQRVVRSERREEQQMYDPNNRLRVLNHLPNLYTCSISNRSATAAACEVSGRFSAARPQLKSCRQ